MKRHMFTLLDLLERNLALFCDQSAHFDRGRVVSHGEFYQNVMSTARNLSARGIASGDRVAIVLQNSVEMFTTLMAIMASGGIAVPVNFRLTAGEVDHILNDSQPSLVVGEAQFSLLLSGWGGPVVSFEELAKPSASSEAQAGDISRPIDSDPALIIYTAAVDGSAKGAVLSHFNLICSAVQIAGIWRITPDDRVIGVLPLFHIAGFGMSLATLSVGGAVHHEATFEVDRVIDVIEGGGGSILGCFPPMLGTILDRAEQGQRTLSSLRVVCGLEAPDTIRRLQESHPQATFWSTYGQSETSGSVTLSPFDEMKGSAGRAIPLVRVAILDEFGSEVSPGEKGEIAVRGPCVFKGYWSQGQLSEEADGWHYTGDIGALDLKGYLWFHGRSQNKALIKTGGENVYPAEVESVLISHPAIADAVVTGVPDATWGEAIAAYCVLVSGETLSTEEIRKHVGESLARYKRPKHIEIVKQIPRGADGTVDWLALKS